MYGVVLGIHLIVCLGLVGVVLLQSGKGGGLTGGTFGGATQTVFGGRGATDFITRATIGLGIAFFLTSLSLALMSSGNGTARTRSIMQEQARKAASTQQSSTTAPVPGSQQSGPGAVPSAVPLGAPAGAPAAPAPAGKPAGGK